LFFFFFGVRCGCSLCSGGGGLGLGGEVAGGGGGGGEGGGGGGGGGGGRAEEAKVTHLHLEVREGVAFRGKGGSLPSPEALPRRRAATAGTNDRMGLNNGAERRKKRYRSSCRSPGPKGDGRPLSRSYGYDSCSIMMM